VFFFRREPALTADLRKPLVDIPSMPCIHYYDQQLLVLNCVDDPIIPNPKTIKSIGPFQFLDAYGPRIRFKRVDRLADPFSHLGRKGLDLTLGSRENQNSMFHDCLGQVQLLLELLPRYNAAFPLCLGN
jgi:hypothetical protein